MSGLNAFCDQREKSPNKSPNEACVAVLARTLPLMHLRPLLFTRPSLDDRYVLHVFFN